MQVQHYRTLPPIPFPGAEGVVRRPIGDLDGKRVQNVELRVFEIQPGGFTPFHSHPHGHEALILHGDGVVLSF